MRSGSIRTILLTVSVPRSVYSLILRFKPYIAERFKAWRHVWEYADTTGYQQTKVAMYAASGGLFGVGLGNGYLKIFLQVTATLYSVCFVKKWVLSWESLW
ncbi:MAG: FtsW/RodA/SpoVE family cell cycle protein [Acutalibacteraceae bacterium]